MDGSRVLLISQAHRARQRVGSFRSRWLEARLLADGAVEVEVLSMRRLGGGLAALCWALGCVVALLRRRRAAVYVTVPPGWALLLVPFARARSASVVVDVRDPISHNLGTRYSNAPVDAARARFRLALFVERWAYRCSTAWVVCTRGALAHYREVFGEAGSDTGGARIRLAENGADVPVTRLVAPRPAFDDVIRAVCTGTLWRYSPADARALLDALQALAVRAGRPVTLELLGVHEPGVEAYLATHCPDVRGERAGATDYEQAVAAIEAAHLGLFTVRNDDTQFGTKVYDYLALRRAVLTVARPSSELVDRFRGQSGFFALPRDASGGAEYRAVLDGLLAWIEAAGSRPVTVDAHLCRDVSMTPLLDALMPPRAESGP